MYIPSSLRYFEDLTAGFTRTLSGFMVTELPALLEPQGKYQGAMGMLEKTARNVHFAHLRNVLAYGECHCALVCKGNIGLIK